MLKLLIDILLVSLVVSGLAAMCQHKNGQSLCSESSFNQTHNLTSSIDGTVKGGESKITRRPREIISPSTTTHITHTLFLKTIQSEQLVQITSTTTVKGDNNNDKEKILNIVIPFVSIMGTAVVLVIVYQLARKYNCCNNKECLDRCSAFCNACMATPYVYQNTRPQATSPAGRPSPHKHVKHKSIELLKMEAEAKSRRIRENRRGSGYKVSKGKSSESVVLNQPQKV
ncbi:uncharacterized protein LOC106063326 [Biomphalaria glabrata]|uniref:Uncharacterized protein LOC106063326 n=1 Tax=Biomphalaria glabrata TaxID=6526 RepID=A0A9U8E8A3_BIOGL|nr:uncharacterized protein LOC106063326 [Biomphalaria glabrata]